MGVRRWCEVLQSHESGLKHWSLTYTLCAQCSSEAVTGMLVAERALGDANLKLMRMLRLVTLLAGALLIASAQVIGDVREAIAMHDFARGEKYVQNYRAKNGVTPEWLEALSWLGRGALEHKKYDQAER